MIPHITDDQQTVQPGVDGYFEPALTIQFLPRCANCSAPHPAARRPALLIDTCPDCGTNVVKPGQTITVPAVLTGWHPKTLLARLCFAIGKTLTKLSKGG